jgi:predicted nuclease with RNAse H fold
VRTIDLLGDDEGFQSMSFSDTVWIGADPGGKGNFGLAILKSNGTVRTCCVDCADKAIEVVNQNVKSTPSGVGVDAPLWWSSGRSADRQVDQWLRKKYSFSGGQVQTANSLRGAALVQGVMFVQRMRERFPDVGVTETHPKAVWKALRFESGNAFIKHFGVTAKLRDEQEHESDAIISAVAAREGFERRWLNDLSRTRYSSEQDPSAFWLAPVHYFWPEQ